MGERSEKCVIINGRELEPEWHAQRLEALDTRHLPAEVGPPHRGAAPSDMNAERATFQVATLWANQHGCPAVGEAAGVLQPEGLEPGQPSVQVPTRHHAGALARGVLPAEHGSKKGAVHRPIEKSVLAGLGVVAAEERRRCRSSDYVEQVHEESLEPAVLMNR